MRPTNKHNKKPHNRRIGETLRFRSSRHFSQEKPLESGSKGGNFFCVPHFVRTRRSFILRPSSSRHFSSEKPLESGSKGGNFFCVPHFVRTRLAERLRLRIVMINNPTTGYGIFILPASFAALRRHFVLCSVFGALAEQSALAR